MKFEIARQLVIVGRFALPSSLGFSVACDRCGGKFCPFIGEIPSAPFSSCACFVGAVEFALLVWVALLAVIAAELYERF